MLNTLIDLKDYSLPLSRSGRCGLWDTDHYTKPAGDVNQKMRLCAAFDQFGLIIPASQQTIEAFTNPEMLHRDDLLGNVRVDVFSVIADRVLDIEHFDSRYAADAASTASTASAAAASSVFSSILVLEVLLSSARA